jgi:hypothetical protein
VVAALLSAHTHTHTHRAVVHVGLHHVRPRRAGVPLQHPPRALQPPAHARRAALRRAARLPELRQPERAREREKKQHSGRSAGEACVFVS